MAKRGRKPKNHWEGDVACYGKDCGLVQHVIVRKITVSAAVPGEFDFEVSVKPAAPSLADMPPEPEAESVTLSCGGKSVTFDSGTRARIDEALRKEERRAKLPAGVAEFEVPDDSDGDVDPGDE